MAAGAIAGAFFAIPKIILAGFLLDKTVQALATKIKVEEAFEQAISSARETLDTLEGERDNYRCFTTEQQAYSGCMITTWGWESGVDSRSQLTRLSKRSARMDPE